MSKPQEKHVPMRTCIATKVTRPKNELIRIVFDPDSKKLEVDLKGKIRARGANLDMTEEAFDIAAKRNLFKNALKLEFNPSKQDYEELKIKFMEAIETKKFREGNKPVKLRIRKEDFEDKISNNSEQITN